MTIYIINVILYWCTAGLWHAVQSCTQLVGLGPKYSLCMLRINSKVAYGDLFIRTYVLASYLLE